MNKIQMIQQLQMLRYDLVKMRDESTDEWDIFNFNKIIDDITIDLKRLDVI